MPTFLPGFYPPFKDLFLYFKGERQDIIDLEGRLRTLVIELIKIRSEKGKIDESLRTSVTKKKSGTYAVIETEIFQKYNKFISKYRKITNALPELTGELDEPTASAMIKELEQKSPKIFTASFFKLSDLSRDIDKLKKRASDCLGDIKPNNLIENDSEAYDEKLNDESGNDHPVFTKYVDKVLGYLSAGNYGNRVGIIGPVGVGKTTVMRKLHNRLMDTKLLFNGDNNSRLDNIIWIPEKMTIQKLQDEIMLQLRIHREKTDSVHANAIVIYKFLRQRKYILLIDHVSESIDLNKLGLREDHKYRNVVVASSDRKAISTMIKDEIEIERLNNDEALELFEKIHGKINDERLEGIADRIVEFCGGLAFVIKSVATYLKNKGESTWLEVERNLQSPTKSVNLTDLRRIEYIFKKRYVELEPSSQKCLLFTALFPNEHIIFKDYLIECWMAECFIKEDDVHKLRRTRDSGQAILDQLTDVYLLDWCLEGKYVKMPSIFRRVALEMKYPYEEKCLIWVPSDDKKLEEETWKTVTRMSLICSETKLPESPECSNISTLLMRSMPELSDLADAFFFNMTRLHVLDLYQTGIVRLPSSVGKLVGLKSLCLNRCKHLEMLPPEASQLTKLEFLDICGTSIPSLPQEVKFMVDLRCLRVTFSPTQKEGEDLHVDVIPLEIIKNLKKLEELSINAGLYSPSSETAEQLAMELANLEYLTTLHFNFPNVKAFNTFVTQSRSLKNKETSWGSATFRDFKIFVGGHDIQHAYESDASKLLAERRLRFSGDEGFSSAGSELLRQTCAFELIGDKGLETLSQYDLRSVKVCVVGSCSHLKNIDDGYTIAAIEGIVEESPRGVFKDLEKLHLYDLQLLECVWKRTNIPQGLHRLTVITLKGCPNLTRILDPELSRALQSLKHLKVDNCCRISQIVEVPNDFNDSKLDDILNSVSSVELMNLPCLQSLCSSNTLSWKSLDSMVIRGCSTLSNLSLTETNAQRLKSFTCESSWWDQLQLADGVKQRLLPFCRFELDMSVQISAELKFEILSSSSSKENLDLDSERDNYWFSTMKKDIKPFLIVNRSGGSSNEMPTDDEWREAGAVNLSGKSSLLLIEKPADCPNLVLLLLQRNNSLSRIPSSFFDQMPALGFLDLSCTRISALPTSLFQLRELKVLMLRSCVCLESLPPEVKNLGNMLALDLSSTDLYYLPEEIGQLTRLKHLQLSFYGPDYGSGYASLSSEILSPSIFSEMKDLVALSIVVHPEDQRWIKIADEIIKYVRLLENLSDLQFYFPTVDALDSFVEVSPSWKKQRVRRFKFVVGNNVKRIISRVPDEVESKYDRLDQCLRFINGSQEVPKVMKRVVKSVKAFYLDHHLDIQHLSEFGICNFKQLEFCVVRECPNFKVMMIGESDVKSAFPNLEHLEMHYLWELKRIWEDPVPPGSFKALTYLVVNTCPKLEYIASQSLLQCLSNLETLIIEDCESLKSIVKENKRPVKSHEATLLPRLTKLVLRHLPLLATLGSGLSPSDKIVISLHFCPNLILSPHPTTSKRLKFLGSCSC